MRGFVSAEGKLIGIESRTSSPVRMHARTKTLQSVSIKGPLPVAARAAAMPAASSRSAIDGLRIAEQIGAGAR